MTYPPPPGDPNQWGAPPPPAAPNQWGPPPVPPSPAPPKQQYVWLYVVFGVVVALLVVGGVWFGVSMLGDRDKDEAGPMTEPKAEVDGGGIVTGEGDPKVDIYVDFGCPACKSFNETNGEAVSKAIGDKKATVVFHPLNFLDSVSETQYSLRAAAASVCAADDGDFYDYYRTLMDNQPAEGGQGLSDEELIDLGTEVGLGEGFAGCVEDGTYLKWIDSVTEKASDITATPTIHIDGKKVETTEFATEFAEATK